MLINVSEGEECRIAILEDGRLEELYMERTSATSHVGNIYKGRVTNVEASIQAAFIDFGLGRNGFLHISDLMPEYFGEHGDDMHESVGHKISRRDRPPIQKCLRRGDEIIVQIIKEGIGTKGPTLTTYLSIPGRILVMMPGMGKMGVSKKIEDDTERRRLRQILDSLKPPKDVGFIIRTAGIGKSKADIERDLKYLVRLHENIEKKRTSGSGPVELYTEGDLITRTVRDLFTNDIERIVVDNEQVAEQLKDFIRIALPRTKNRVELYDGPVPLFHKFNIESEIELMHSRHVPLPSGGSLVIDSTEAIVAIDVNSGKSREHADAEMMAFNTDMEAADEIPRQLKLRDLGGVIICDFIDLRFERHRRELEQRLEENMNRDRAKTKVLRMSQFGIIELTRQRMRPSLKRSIYSDCPHCRGSGLVKTPESMTLDVMRRLALAIHDERVQAVDLWVCADVSAYLQNRKRAALAALEVDTGKRITIRINPALALDEAKFDCYDEREGLVTIEALQAPGTAQKESSRGGRRGRRGGRNRSGRAQQQLPASRGQQSAPINGGELFDEEDVDRHEDHDSADGEAVGGQDFENAEGEDQRDSHQHDDDWQERRPQQGRSDQRRDGRNDQRNQPQRNDRRSDNRNSRDNRGDTRRDDRSQGRGDSRRDENRQDNRRDDRNQSRGDNRRDDNRRDDQPRNDRGQGRSDNRRGDNRRDEVRQDNRGDNRAGNRNEGRRDNRDDRNRDRNRRDDRRDEPRELPGDQFPHDETLPAHHADDAPEPGNELYPEQSDRGGQGQSGDQGDGTRRRRRRRRRGGRGRRGRGNGGGENAGFQQSGPVGDINRYANERRPDAYADSDPEAEFETETEMVSGEYEQPVPGYVDRSEDDIADRDSSVNVRQEEIVAYAAEESIEDRYEIPSDATEPEAVEPPAPSVAVTDVDAPVIEEPAAETAPVEEEKPAKKKRSTRAKSTTAKPKATTTRTRRTKKATDAAQSAGDASEKAQPAKEAAGDAAEPVKPARSRSTGTRARAAAKAADSHLMKNDDELDAVEHLEERPRRPRSFVDLDSIPDDLD